MTPVFSQGGSIKLSQAVRVMRKKAHCHQIYEVTAMIDNQQAAVSTERVRMEDQSFLFLSVLLIERGTGVNVALTPAQMTSNS